MITLTVNVVLHSSPAPEVEEVAVAVVIVRHQLMSEEMTTCRTAMMNQKTTELNAIDVENQDIMQQIVPSTANAITVERSDIKLVHVEIKPADREPLH